MPRPKTPLLSRDRIVDAALELYDRDGGLTIAGLALSLGVQPSSLYNHIGGKGDLLRAIAQRLHDEISAKVSPDVGWQEAIRIAAHAQRDALSRRPWAITMLAQSPAQSDGAITMVENLATVLVRGGFRTDDVLLIIGAVDVIAIGGAIDATSPDELFPASVVGDDGALADAVRGRAPSPEGDGARARDTFAFLLNAFISSLRPSG